MTFFDEDRYQGPEIKALKTSRTKRYMDRYRRLGANVFKWYNLPNDLRSGTIESKLLDGTTLMYESKEQGVTLAKPEVIGWTNADEPRKIRALQYNQHEPFVTYTRPELINGVNCVLLQDTQNYTYSRLDYIRNGLICEMMTDIDIAIKQQIINQRAPLMFTSDGVPANEKGKVFVRAVLNGVNAYIGSGGLEGELKTLNLESPYNVESLEIMRKNYFNEGLELLGVNNSEAMKKRERMNNSEVAANSELLSIYLTDAYEARKTAQDMINDVFDADCYVELCEHQRISGPEYEDSEDYGDDNDV